MALLSQGLSLHEVARRVKASVASVHRWQQASLAGGFSALDPKPASGRPGKLTDGQRAKLLDLLLAGAMAAGFANELWTLKRIRSVIRREFGVKYHPSHIWKILQGCGWSCQVPERRAIQRDEEAIERWKNETWPEIKKARELGAHIAFLDESGFMLIPTRRRTWGPKGETPVVHYSYKHDRISALGALTVSAKRHHMGLYIRFRQDNFKAPDVAEFLRAMLRHLHGHVILLWDNGRIHKGPIIAAVLEDNPRLHVEWFPGYAPELNPAEQIWNDFKGHTANSLPRTKQDIRITLHNSTRRVRKSQDKLRSFVLSSDIPSPPW